MGTVRWLGVVDVGPKAVTVIRVLLNDYEWCYGSRWLGVVYVGPDDVNVVWILSDGCKWCTWVQMT